MAVPFLSKPYTRGVGIGNASTAFMILYSLALDRLSALSTKDLNSPPTRRSKRQGAWRELFCKASAFRISTSDPNALAKYRWYADECFSGFNIDPPKSRPFKGKLPVSYPAAFLRSARQTRSGVAGLSLRSAPQACIIALPTAGATPSIGISATAFTPNG